MDDEAQNLRKYASERCETAFARLVQKHAGMVFGTAFRCTGDRELAEEISQKVFTIMARKAPGLRLHGSIAGWLHRTTLLQTRNFVRRQQRQREKMKALAEYEESVAEGESQNSHEVLNVLDEAINKLSPADRRVILMRFFEGLSVREIAVAIGKSEAASQKQSHRALQKLSVLLKRSGVVVPAGVLISQIVPITSEAASASLATALSKNALAGAASVSTGTLAVNTLLTLTYGKPILALVTAVVISAAVMIPLTLKSNGEDTSSAASPTPESETGNPPPQSSNHASAEDPFATGDAGAAGTQQALEFEFKLVEMPPNIADSIQTAMAQDAAAASTAMEELDQRIQQGSVKLLGELSVQSKGDTLVRASEGAADEPATIRNNEDWEPLKKEGLNIELGYQPHAGRIHLSVYHYTKGKGADAGKLAELKLNLARAFVPGVPTMIYRSDRDGMARLLVATMRIGPEPQNTASRELMAQLYEFESDQARDTFYQKNQKSTNMMAQIQGAAQLRYQAVCVSSPETVWKLGDLADLQSRGDDQWTKDGTSLYVEAGAAIKGTFFYEGVTSTIAEGTFADLEWGEVRLIKCEGSKPCVLVIQSKATGEGPPSTGDLDNEDPFADQ